MTGRRCGYLGRLSSIAHATGWIRAYYSAGSGALQEVDDYGPEIPQMLWIAGVGPPRPPPAEERKRMAYPTHLLPTTVVGSYPQPAGWWIARH